VDFSRRACEIALTTSSAPARTLYFESRPSTMAAIFPSAPIAMDISHILSPGRTRNRVAGGSKKRVLEQVAKLIAADNPALDADDLFRKLIARERLGSTGIGRGVAVPHCRVENCAGPVGTLLTLEDEVDFEAVDDAPVDIVFTLLVPDEAQDDHLQTLAALAETFSDPENLKRLRSTTSDEELFETAKALFST